MKQCRGVINQKKKDAVVTEIHLRKKVMLVTNACTKTKAYVVKKMKAKGKLREALGASRAYNFCNECGTIHLWNLKNDVKTDLTRKASRA